MNRSTLQTLREPRLYRAKIFQGILVAIFMLFVFFHLDIYDGDTVTKATTNLTSLVGAIYFTSVVQMFTNFQPTIIIFQAEKPIFMRERAGDMYDVWIYTLCKFIAELPVLLLVPLAQNLLLFWTVGYQHGIGHFFQFYLILIFIVQSACALGYCLSSLFNHETTAVAIAPLFSLTLNVLGGYMVNLNTLVGPQKSVEWL